MQVVCFRSELINKNTEKKKKADGSLRAEADSFFVSITKEAGARPITGEIGSPYGEDATGCKGLNKGDFIDCAPLDLVIFLQPVINRLAAGSLSLPVRTESPSPPPAPALLRSPISPRCSAAGINFFSPSPFSGVRFIFPPSPLTGRAAGFGAAAPRGPGSPAAGRAPPPSRGRLNLATPPFPSLRGGFLWGLLRSF